MHVMVEGLADVIQANRQCLTRFVAGSINAEAVRPKWSTLGYTACFLRDGQDVNLTAVLTSTIFDRIMNAPGTIVLVAGDIPALGDNTSDLVCSAVTMGWNVELWVWTRQLSDAEWLQHVATKFLGRLRICALDVFRSSLTFIRTLRHANEDPYVGFE